MSEIRYATVQLKIERTQPLASVLPELLHEWGMTAQTQEVLWVVAYDSLMNVRTVVEVARGSYNEMDVPIPAVLTVPLIAACDRFCIVHNHPSGGVEPTVLDVDLTRKILTAANLCGLYFEDHYIVSPDGSYYSFFESGMIPPRVVSRGHRRARAAS